MQKHQAFGLENYLIVAATYLRGMWVAEHSNASLISRSMLLQLLAGILSSLKAPTELISQLDAALLIAKKHLKALMQLNVYLVTPVLFSL